MRKTDRERGEEIAANLKSSTRESGHILCEENPSADRLRFALLRYSSEVQEFISPYRRQAQSMAERETELWRHAFGCAQTFFDNVTMAVHVYFRKKLELMEADIEKSGHAFRGMQDSSKKLLEPANLVKKGVATVLDKLDIDIGDDPIVDTRTVVEKVLDVHLSSANLQDDATKILEEAHQAFEADWKKVIDENTPSGADLRALGIAAAPARSASRPFELGVAEGTLLTGLSAAAAATVGLAVGWHTVSYALVNVFPPAAVLAVVATVGAAIFTKEHAQMQRISAVTKAVEDCDRTFITLIHTAKLEPLGSKTLREYIAEGSRVIVDDCLKRWWAAVGGNLGPEHFASLVHAADARLISVSDCLDILDTPPKVAFRESWWQGLKSRFHFWRPR